MKSSNITLMIMLMVFGASNSLLSNEPVTIKNEKDNHAICKLLQTTYDAKTDTCVGITGCQWDLARAEYSLQQTELNPQSKRTLLHAKKAIQDAKTSCKPAEVK